MSSRLAVLVVASALGVGACTTTGSTPATTPPITAPPATTTTSTLVPSTTSVVETTTTLDRVAEIQAIFQELEVRRLQAIMDQDEEAFRAVFANEEYEERSVGGMALVTVIDPNAVVFRVKQVFADEETCIAVGAIQDGTSAIDGAGVEPISDYVVEFLDGRWGYSWIGSGWRCDGPHPFSDS